MILRLIPDDGNKHEMTRLIKSIVLRKSLSFDIDGLVQERRNSSVLVMELH